MYFPSAEVRWFFPGIPDPGLEAWFRQSFTGVGAGERTDYYLRDTGPALNIKLREGRVEVKQQLSRTPAVCLRRTLTGHLEEWGKWSFSLADTEGPIRLAVEHSDAWMPVHKRRLLRTFIPELDEITETAPGSYPVRGCQAELAFVQRAGEPWYTIGLEAFGEGADRQGLLRSVADYWFDADFPLLLAAETSMSYAEWMMSR